MDSVAQITDLSDLLKLDKGQVITNYTTSPFTSSFENYGSLMLSLVVTTKDEENGKEETTQNLVCKLYPTDPLFKVIFEIDKTFAKEVQLYTIIIPTLTNFQTKLNVPPEYSLDHIFVKCFGARVETITPDKSTEGAIVMENVKIQGYKVEDRLKGFNREQTELVLRKLALFHAVPIALKQKTPKQFQERILPYLETVNANVGDQYNQLIQVRQEILIVKAKIILFFISDVQEIFALDPRNRVVGRKGFKNACERGYQS